VSETVSINSSETVCFPYYIFMFISDSFIAATVWWNCQLDTQVRKCMVGVRVVGYNTVQGVLTVCMGTDFNF
jgi:hypothetical protein